MKYLLTIYDDESMWSDVQPGDVNAMMDGYRKFGEEVHGNGAFVAGEALESISTATTVRVKDGERLVTDGPFAETKEQLGGFYLLDCKDLDEAIAYAAKIPGAQSGCVEVRPGQGLRVVAPGAAIDRLFRHESGRAVASLIRVLGDFDLAEEAVQEAWVVALERWPRDGVPRNPGAWITTTARNRAIDRLRRARVLEEKRAQLAALRGARRRRGGARRLPRRPPAADVHLLPPGARAPRRGSRSRCARSAGCRCRRSRARSSSPSRRWRSGSCAPSARSPSPGSPTACPRSDELPHRLPSVLAAVYLIFNEGYAATAGEALVRRELCAEAIRLGRLLAELMPRRPEPRGLLALMLLHHARRDARVDADGRLVLLSDQDRSLWHADEIEEGRALAARARRPTATALQAAIAAEHVAPTRTDWAPDRRALRRGSPRSTRAR